MERYPSLDPEKIALMTPGQAGMLMNPSGKVKSPKTKSFDEALRRAREMKGKQ